MSVDFGCWDGGGHEIALVLPSPGTSISVGDGFPFHFHM